MKKAKTTAMIGKKISKGPAVYRRNMKEMSIMTWFSSTPNQKYNKRKRNSTTSSMSPFKTTNSQMIRKNLSLNWVERHNS